MARCRRSEITQSNGRVNADLACNWKKRVTRVLSPTLSKLPCFFKMRGEVGKRSGKIPQTGFQSAIGLPLDNLLDETRSIRVRHSKASADDVRRLDFELGSPDSGITPKPLKSGQQAGSRICRRMSPGVMETVSSHLKVIGRMTASLVRVSPASLNQQTSSIQRQLARQRLKDGWRPPRSIS